MEINGICFERIDTGGNCAALVARDLVANGDWQLVLTGRHGVDVPESDWLLCLYANDDWQLSGYEWRGDHFPSGVAEAVQAALDIASGRNFQNQFPDYPRHEMPPCPKLWRDSSWKNDTCPSYMFGDEMAVWLQVFCDYPEPSEREIPEASRFSLNRNGESIYDSQSWLAMSKRIEIETLALRFACDLKADLTAAEWQEVRKRNSGYSPGICASHDFRDSNLIMSDSFEAVTGREMRTNSQADSDLWNQAWQIARDNYLKADSPEVTSELSAMTQRFNAWLAERPHYPKESADELRARLMEWREQIPSDLEWLAGFCREWEAAERERDAAAMGEPFGESYRRWLASARFVADVAAASNGLDSGRGIAFDCGYIKAHGSRWLVHIGNQESVFGSIEAAAACLWADYARAEFES